MGYILSGCCYANNATRALLVVRYTVDRVIIVWLTTFSFLFCFFVFSLVGLFMVWQAFFVLVLLPLGVAAATRVVSYE